MEKFFKLNVELRWRQSDIVVTVQCPPQVSLTTGANLPPATLDVTVHRRYIIDNGSKFTAGVVGTGGKFTACVTAISANLGNGVSAGVSRRFQ
jgi:hypothetical protein